MNREMKAASRIDRMSIGPSLLLQTCQKHANLAQDLVLIRNKNVMTGSGHIDYPHAARRALQGSFIPIHVDFRGHVEPLDGSTLPVVFRSIRGLPVIPRKQRQNRSADIRIIPLLGSISDRIEDATGSEVTAERPVRIQNEAVA